MSGMNVLRGGVSICVSGGYDIPENILCICCQTKRHPVRIHYHIPELFLREVEGPDFAEYGCWHLCQYLFPLEDPGVGLEEGLPGGVMIGWTSGC